MKTFGEFQEAVAAVKALPTIVKAFTKVAPMVAPKLQTFAKFSTAIPVGLAGLGMLQASKGRPERGEAKRYKQRKDRNPNKRKRKLSAAEKKIFDAQNKDIIQKGSEDFSTKGLIKRSDKFTNQTTRGTTKNSDAGYTIEDVAPTNNVGGGQIAGTVEAGDDPPVKKKRKKGKKKKRYIYGGRGSRKMWMPEKDK